MKNNLISSLIFLLLINSALFAQDDPARLSLQDCYMTALEHNWQLKMAKADVSIAEIEREKLKTAYFPSVEANSTFSTLNIPEFALNQLTWNNTVSANLTLFDFGKRRKNIASAQAQTMAVDLGYHLTWMDLKENIALAYINVLQSQEILKVLLKRNENDKALLDEVNERYEIGVTRYSNLLQARVAFNNSTTAIAVAEKNLESSINQLEIPLNRPLNIDGVEGSLEMFYEMPEEDYSIDAFPEMLRAEAEARAQEAVMESARADLKPTVAAYGTAGYGNSMFIDYGFNWNAGINLSIPLFNAGRLRKNVEQEKVRLQQLGLGRVGLKWEIQRQLESTEIAIEEASQRIDNLKFALTSAEENVTIAEGEFREGLTSFNSVTDARIFHLNAELEYINALADLRRAQIKKLRLLGTL
ncbi:MAG: TolC family protein [Bacteroidetes bacterium]|nr:MAG: TolC family protein [Bacteroidota bacterium]